MLIFVSVTLVPQILVNYIVKKNRRTINQRKQKKTKKTKDEKQGSNKKIRCQFVCSRKISNSCFTHGTHRATPDIGETSVHVELMVKLQCTWS